MKHLFIALVVSFTFCSAATGRAGEVERIKEVMDGYWAAYISRDFAGAAKYIFEEDLEKVKNELPPVFMEASKMPEKDAKEMAAAFFGPVPPDQRSSMTPIQAFEGLNRFIVAGVPNVFEVLKDSKITMNAVELDGPDAVLHYSISVEGEITEDTEKFIKKDGKWSIRVKQNPKDIAEGLRALLAQ